MATDNYFMFYTVKLAKAAGKAGNLPIGAVIALNGEIIAEGQNRLYTPVLNPGRHAEIDALMNVDPTLWDRASEMVLYTTLAPCRLAESISIALMPNAPSPEMTTTCRSGYSSAAATP